MEAIIWVEKEGSELSSALILQGTANPTQIH